MSDAAAELVISVISEFCRSMSRAFLAGAAAGAAAVWAYGFIRSRFYDDDDESSSDETSSDDEEPSPQRVGAVRDDYDGDE